MKRIEASEKHCCYVFRQPDSLHLYNTDLKITLHKVRNIFQCNKKCLHLNSC